MFRILYFVWICLQVYVGAMPTPDSRSNKRSISSTNQHSAENDFTLPILIDTHHEFIEKRNEIKNGREFSSHDDDYGDDSNYGNSNYGNNNNYFCDNWNCHNNNGCNGDFSNNRRCQSNDCDCQFNENGCQNNNGRCCNCGNNNNARCCSERNDGNNNNGYSNGVRCDGNDNNSGCCCNNRNDNSGCCRSNSDNNNCCSSNDNNDGNDDSDNENRNYNAACCCGRSVNKDFSPSSNEKNNNNNNDTTSCCRDNNTDKNETICCENACNNGNSDSNECCNDDDCCDDCPDDQEGCNDNSQNGGDSQETNLSDSPYGCLDDKSPRGDCASCSPPLDENTLCNPRGDPGANFDAHEHHHYHHHEPCCIEISHKHCHFHHHHHQHCHRHCIGCPCRYDNYKYTQMECHGNDQHGGVSAQRDMLNNGTQNATDAQLRNELGGINSKINDSSSCNQTANSSQTVKRDNIIDNEKGHKKSLHKSKLDEHHAVKVCLCTRRSGVKHLHTVSLFKHHQHHRRCRHTHRQTKHHIH